MLRVLVANEAAREAAAGIFAVDGSAARFNARVEAAEELLGMKEGRLAATKARNGGKLPIGVSPFGANQRASKQASERANERANERARERERAINRAISLQLVT